MGTPQTEGEYLPPAQRAWLAAFAAWGEAPSPQALAFERRLLAARPPCRDCVARGYRRPRRAAVGCRGLCRPCRRIRRAWSRAKK